MLNVLYYFSVISGGLSVVFFVFLIFILAGIVMSQKYRGGE